MRILFLHDDPPTGAHGGAAVAMDRLRRGLASSGHEVMLVTTHREGNPIDRRHDTVGEIASIRTAYDLRRRHWRCIRNPDTLSPLDQILQEIKPDVVHAHNIHTYLSYESLLHASRVTSSVFLTAHDTFLVSFHRLGSEGYLGDTLAGRLHRMSWLDHVRVVGRRFNPFRNRAIRRILHQSGTTVIAVSHALESFLQANAIERTVTIHNAGSGNAPASAEDIAAFRTRHTLSGPTILFGGRLSVEKGFDALLHVMEKVLQTIPSAQLIIIGDHERARPFLERARPEVQAATRVTGWIAPEQMSIAYGAADVVTTPSLYLDAFNLMNVEAMEASRPVVASCFGAATEIIEDGTSGFIVDPRDTDAYAHSILTLLRNEPLRRRMGETGQKRSREEFSLLKQVAAHVQLYGGH
ncbi:MAG: putative glycosyltransferase [Candidatus Peregrinibacteria bacterium Greene0416_19]|nr:MAG: putative glycosyltransferase [Candidatus Peregrinibacteria bacterium Greene0416_19]